MRITSLYFCCLCTAWTKSEPPLCSHCWNLFFQHQNGVHWRRVKQLSVISLVEWGESFELANRTLVYHLKESRNPNDFFEFARLLILRLPKELLEDSLFIPIPSSTGRRHSTLLASALSQLTGRPVAELLKLNGNTPTRQPGLSRAERKKRSFTIANPGDNLPYYKTVLLVDDVVTTGASLLGAQIALEALDQSPERVLGLALFDRVLRTTFAPFAL